MSMIFKFRMLSDENDHFVRDYEVPYDMTLLQFHEFLTRSLGYRDDGLASFFLADDQWRVGREFTLVDMGENAEDAPVPMSEVVLGQLLHQIGERLIYQFDMLGERSYYLELTGAQEAEAGREYPRTAFEHGPAPDQYDPEATPAGGSIFDDIMDDFSDFEGEEGMEDE